MCEPSLVEDYKNLCKVFLEIVIPIVKKSLSCFVLIHSFIKFFFKFLSENSKQNRYLYKKKVESAKKTLNGTTS